MTSFVSCLPVNLNLLYQHSLLMKHFLGCDWKLSLGRINILHTYLLTLYICGGLCRGYMFCGWIFYHKLIECPQGNNLNYFLLVFVEIVFSSGRINTEIVALIYKHHHQTRHFLRRYINIKFFLPNIYVQWK